MNWRQRQENANEVFLRRMGCAFDSPNVSDITVQAQGRVFNVHRSILAVQSPVFRSMINTNMSEAISERFVITDMDSTVAHSLVSYLYTAAVDDACNIDEIPEGTWYIVHENGPSMPSITDLARPKDQEEKKEFCRIRKQGESLFVQLQNGQAVMPLESSHKWTLNYDHDGGDPDKPTTIELSEWRIYLERQDYQCAILHCKDGELKFARCWGRLLEAADKYCMDDLLKQCASACGVLPRCCSPPTGRASIN